MTEDQSTASAPLARPRIILVTDPTYKDDRVVEVVEQCCRALPPGVFGVQLRDRRKDTAQLRAFAERLRIVTKEHGAMFLVNGNVTLAKELEADGVHLGGSAMKVPQARALLGDVFVTVAAHSDDAVRLGAADGANGALVSSIFAVPGKAVGRGVEALRSARAVAPAGFSIYALGGVDRTNSADCARGGADGVAAIRALLLAQDPAAEARAIHESLSSGLPS
jgi:thiamine-phosphate pyrophosphorylase